MALLVLLACAHTSAGMPATSARKSVMYCRLVHTPSVILYKKRSRFSVGSTECIERKQSDLQKSVWDHRH
eukprot:4915884-Pleurochrysis_carterae.AAC.2